MTRKRGKGWTRVAQYSNKEKARKKAEYLRPKFNHVIVEKGTRGAAWVPIGGKKRTVYRVWVK